MDELGDSLGDRPRRGVITALQRAAGARGITVLGTCQDSVLDDAARVCGEILYFVRATGDQRAQPATAPCPASTLTVTAVSCTMDITMTAKPSCEHRGDHRRFPIISLPDGVTAMLIEQGATRNGDGELIPEHTEHRRAGGRSRTSTSLPASPTGSVRRRRSPPAGETFLLGADSRRWDASIESELGEVAWPITLQLVHAGVVRLPLLGEGPAAGQAAAVGTDRTVAAGAPDRADQRAERADEWTARAVHRRRRRRAAVCRAGRRPARPAVRRQRCCRCWWPPQKIWWAGVVADAEPHHSPRRATRILGGSSSAAFAGTSRLR